MILKRLAILMICLLALLPASPARAEDGYQLWLRYAAADDQSNRVVVETTRQSETLRIARAELEQGLTGIEGGSTRVVLAQLEDRIEGVPRDLARAEIGEEGFVIRSIVRSGVPTVLIAAKSDIGLLYGAFHYLRLQRTGIAGEKLDIVERPRVRHRLLNHWDNLDRTVERGYAGQSIWDWWKLPDAVDQRYIDYARANASIGINGAVLNNVNAKSDSLTASWIAKAAKLAEIFRPYGIRVYLSARWSAPVEIGGLKSADPLEPAVAAWWKTKADEIYRAIPDFGGFLVKANSEGQPGPQDYGRTHADGANMLAAALKPHGGIVMWRAFVYQHENPEDRAKQAYDDFKPLDGTFADNVIVQVKNGAIDFQPREPFHPLFGAMPGTPLMMEFQITKEYLGFATHLAFLVPLYAETLSADSFAKGKGSAVAKVIDGSLDGHRLTGMAGIANIGSDRNWSGSIFDQANWYAFGRLAWDHRLDPEAIATEWVRQTFTHDRAFVEPVVAMMLQSREAVVDYMTPLGLAHLMATGHHYGPAPWVSDLARPEWNPVYYHRADAAGIGFDRTESGSNAVAQYAPPVARVLAARKTVPDKFLLWFHRVGWDEKMRSGKMLWEELLAHYDRGVAQVGKFRRTWAGLAAHVDAERFDQISSYLAIQEKEARWWRDASIAYFAKISGRPLPPDVRPPAHPLEYYQALDFPYAPGN